jgi:hypothetical protein
MRRRGGRHSRDTYGSMRAVFNLDGWQGDTSERLGKALDGLDSFLVSSGKLLRYNAVARLLFVAYLLVLHLWTFLLIFFHVHGLETVHGKFGPGLSIPHGPHALMQQPIALDVPSQEKVLAPP